MAARISLVGGPDLRVLYRNWRGETAVRNIRPQALHYGSTDWHPAPQWLLEGLDLDRGVLREFAVADMVPLEAGQVVLGAAEDRPDQDPPGEARGGFMP